jgi:hypothetical protein
MGLRRTTVLLTTVLASGCAAPRTAPERTTGETHVTLHGHSLKLHLSNPVGSTRRAKGILIVFATGDAGWWGKDRSMYNHVVRWGYPVVGFSAREYVHHLGADAITPVEIARDYEAIVDTGRRALGMEPAARAVLVGKSRGAGLAVAAAVPPAIRPELAGIVAVGLTREEEYVYRVRRWSGSRQRVMLAPYRDLPRLGDLPVAVIQSAGDSYVPAAEARQLFGPDSGVRELIPVAGRDHNFGGALNELYDQMERSIEWIVTR